MNCPYLSSKHCNFMSRHTTCSGRPLSTNPKYSAFWSAFGVTCPRLQRLASSVGFGTPARLGPRKSKEPANRLAEVEYGLKRRGYSGSEGARGRARFVLGHRLGGVASPVCRGLEFGPRKSSWPPCKRCPYFLG